MLRDLEVLIVDCQASGATPEHGDLLQIAWAVHRSPSSPPGDLEIEALWVRPKSDRTIPSPVRRLLGWSEACLASAVLPEQAWARLLARATPAMPTLIHWARFELPFLRELHGGDPPLDILCLHAIAERLFPGLPRKNLRALAGHLGHSADIVRRADGHVAATAFIWRAIVPRLEREGLATWADLSAWLERPFTRTREMVFPYSPEKRRQLSTSPGVYRFLRSNGDVLYVGKAASIRKRVMSHFATRSAKTDALEMLTQVAEVSFTETATAVEAALLEVEEIHRLDPPYNVQLRSADRRAWFASVDFDDVRDAPDAQHPIGPLPSQGAVAGLAAMTKLVAGASPDDALLGAAVGVPRPFAPPADVFADPWRRFAPRPAFPTTSASVRALLARGRALHPLREDDRDDVEQGWTPERIHRHLARTLAGEALVVRRSRLLCLLLDAQVRFVDGGCERTIDPARTGPCRPRLERQAAFGARAYDRLRVFATELRRVHLEGGLVEIRIGSHRLLPGRVFA